MTRLEANRAILKELLSFFEANPHMRFEQTLDRIVLDINFYRESTDTLALTEIVLKQLNSPVVARTDNKP